MNKYMDAIKCTNCNAELLLPCGCDTCPICHTEGCNMWLDDQQELTIDEAKTKYPNIKIFMEVKHNDYI